MAELLLNEGAAPSTPSTGKVSLYAKADGLLYAKDDTGVEIPLGVAGSGITSLGGEVGVTQTFADVDDTNVTLTITSGLDVHTFTMGWTGTLALARLVAASGTSQLLGRGDSGAGVHQEITLGSGLAMTGTVLSTTGGYTDEQAQDAIGAMLDATLAYVDATPLLTRAALTGDVTAPQASNVTTIANNAVTNAKMADVATSTLKGRVTAATGDPEDLTVAQAKTLLNLTGTNSGDQTIDLIGDVTGTGTSSFVTSIANGIVSNTKLANVPTATIKGRITAATGSPENLTVTEVTSLLNEFTSALKGLAPASGGGATNFLRADGTWNVPTGSGQVALQFKDEGSDLGTNGTADVIDFVGAGVVATRVSNAVTVTIAGGSGVTQDQILNLASLRA